MTSRRQTLALFAASALLPWPALAQTTFDHTYAAWDALLKKHVRWLPDGKQSRASYKGFAADRAALKTVLDGMSAVPQATFDGWSRPQQMAFLINAYNAFTVELILTKYPDLKSIKDLGSFVQSAWKQKFFTLLGEQLAQMTQTLQIIGVYALVELAQRQVIRTQAKSPNEALAEIDGQISGIDLPEAFSCTLQHQLQNALRLLPLMLAGLELLAGLLHGIGQATDLGDMTVRHGWQILALAQAGRHVDDAIDGLGL